MYLVIGYLNGIVDVWSYETCAKHITIGNKVMLLNGCFIQNGNKIAVAVSTNKEVDLVIWD